MFYQLPENFFDLVYEKYDQALKDGFLKFNGESVESEYTTLKLGNLDVNLQYNIIHSLMHRPEKGDFHKNPFENPEPELTVIEDFGDSNQFRIVYNKFPVVPRHLMFLTKQYKPQTTPLSPDELKATYSILKTLATDPKDRWFAFYNCGQESGASQPHKHVQFMTLPKDFKPYPDFIVSESDSFIPDTKREPLQNPGIPMAHFIAKLPTNLNDLSEDDLIMYFTSLLQRTLTVLRENDANSISYNVIMTTEYIMMVPRSLGKYKELGINSCGILGLFLFKNEDLLKIVQDDTPQKVWEMVGFPNTAGQKSDEYHY